MKSYPIYQVDAFTSEIFKGNPAAVMPLKAWLPDGVLQALAAENNLSETAFFVPEPEASEADFHIRWFTPEIEVPLCGHATLASAWVIFNKLGWTSDRIRLRSKSGPLGQAPGLFSTNWVGLQTGFACAPKAVRLACTSNPTVGWFWISQILRLPNNLHPASYLKLWRMRRLRFFTSPKTPTTCWS